MSKEIHMENVRNIGLETLEFIQAKLKEYNIELTEQQEDELYCPLIASLEKITKYPDYANYN